MASTDRRKMPLQTRAWGFPESDFGFGVSLFVAYLNCRNQATEDYKSQQERTANIDNERHFREIISVVTRDVLARQKEKIVLPG